MVTKGTLGAILKKVFDKPGRVVNAILEAHPVLDMFKRTPGFGGGAAATAAPYAGGLQMCPIKYARGSGRSATWANAVANVGNGPRALSFVLDSRDQYGYQTVDKHILHSGQTVDESFVQGLEKMVEEDVLGMLGDNIAGDIFGDGFGVLGWVDATWGGAAVVIPIAGNGIHRFYEGQVLVAAANTGAALCDAGITLTVIAVDKTTLPGTITVDGLGGHAQFGALAGALIPLWAEGDYLGAGADIKISGLAAWVPYVAPATGVAFYGVDRYLDIAALAGLRLNRIGFTMSEALIDTKNEVKKFTNKPADVLLCSPDRWGQYEKELESHGFYERSIGKTEAGIGYEYLKCGGAEVVYDTYCDLDLVYGLTKSTWELYYQGPDLAFLMDDDGSVIMRQPAATGNDYEIRAASWANLGCHFPGGNCVTLV